MLSIPNIPFVEFNLIFLQEFTKLVLKSFLLVVCLLIENVFLHLVDVRLTHRECTVSFLPVKLPQAGSLSFHPFDELRLIAHTILAIEWFFDNTKRQCT